MTLRDSSSTRTVPSLSVPARVRWGLTGIVASVILVFSILPPGGGTSGMGPLALVGMDKWLHVSAYGTLAAVTAWADGRPSVGAIVAVCYSVLIELVQAPLASRTMSARDLAANGVGALLGVTVLLALAWAYRRYVAAASARSTPEK